MVCHHAPVRPTVQRKKKKKEKPVKQEKTDIIGPLKTESLDSYIMGGARSTPRQTEESREPVTAKGKLPFHEGTFSSESSSLGVKSRHIVLLTRGEPLWANIDSRKQVN